MQHSASSGLAITGISELFVGVQGPVSGRSMAAAPCISDAVVLIRGQRIEAIGTASELSIPEGYTQMDAQGGCVVPGLIDCHTHAVYAGSRDQEFVQRIQGKSYAEIAEAGGGIRVTVDAVRQSTEDQLTDGALPRLHRMLQHGTTTAEVKSGYGLTPHDELKMLRVIRRLAGRQPISLVPTYLAAHTIPREFAGRPDEYLDTVLQPGVLQQIQADALAEFADVFCERTAFNVSQARRFLLSCKQYGLKSRLHADQITQCGASKLAAEIGAVSADHLEHVDDENLAALRTAGTIAVLLPGCSFFLGVEQAPARKILDADLPVAIATDLNPGSSLIESMPLILSMACTQMRMTPTEALLAATANAAAVLQRPRQIGALLPGMMADILLLDVPNHQQWPYHVGRNCVRRVIKRGQVVWEARN